MIAIPEIWSEIETEQAWREAELRLLNNQIARQSDPREQDMLRRSAVVMLYAHFEGFCRFVLTLYVRAVNDLGLTCGQASYALAAASLSDLFAALRDPNRKCPEFRTALPDDTALHRLARERDFVRSSDDFSARPLAVPDAIVNAEGNLKPITLRKVLFRLGLAYDHLAEVDGKIHRLLNYRNDIAHGSLRRGLSAKEYEEIRDGVVTVARALIRQVTGALSKRHYLRAG